MPHEEYDDKLNIIINFEYVLNYILKDSKKIIKIKYHL